MPSNGQKATTNGLVLVVAVLVAGMLVQSAYQTFRLLDDRERLAARVQAQEPTVVDVRKVRAQLLSLAGQTALLAEKGNENALRLIDQLRTQGVIIRPPAR